MSLLFGMMLLSFSLFLLMMVFRIVLGQTPIIITRSRTMVYDKRNGEIVTKSIDND